MFGFVISVCKTKIHNFISVLNIRHNGEVHFLEDLSNQDLYVKMIKEKFDKIPDLPNEIMEEQIKEFIQKHPEWERLINHYFK
jgi:GTP-binding protein EngB required for normal cell division